MARRYQRLGPGIWIQGGKIRARQRVGSSRDQKQFVARASFPLTDKPLPAQLRVVKAWQAEERARGLNAKPATIARGTLAADVPAFLASLPKESDEDREYYNDSAAVLKHWQISDLGARPLATIEPLDIETQMSQWRDDKVAVETINRRVSRLRAMCQRLDRKGPNPTIGVKGLKPPVSEPRDVPLYVVKMIIDSLPDQGRGALGKDRPTVSHTKLRMRVMAFTGMQQRTARRVTVRDIDFEGARLYLQFRRKGRGVVGLWVSLLPEAVEALREFAAAGLVGKRWSNSSLWKSWQTAIRRARARAAALKAAGHPEAAMWVRELENLPDGCRPYDLRHSFASEIYAQTGDIRAVAALMHHANLQTTERYTKGRVAERVRIAIDTAAVKLAAMPTFPPPSTNTPAHAPRAAANPPRALRLVREAKSARG